MLLSLILIIGTPFLIAALTLAVARRRIAWAGWLALAAPAAVIALGVPLWREVAAGGLILVPLEWIPSLGITANLRVDRLGAFFVLLIGLIGLGVVQYSRYYLGSKATGGFWALLLAFMGSMLGIVLSDSLILLFVFWELTTITSALLIGLHFEEEDARRGAIQAFLVTGSGGLAMLAGIVLLGQMAGSYDLSVLAARRAEILADPNYLAPMLLMLLGAFTKSAQFPFHFWLPGAMAAPAPISAYLHSATMVKAGVFLIGRLLPIFGASPVWLPLLVTVGLVTFFVAGWSAIRAYDLKQLLAHSTVAYLGVLVALYGYAPQTGLRGELLHILNHAVYKSSLFLLIGWVEKRMGTRDLRILAREGWYRREPAAAVLVGIGALAMAGLPFLLGFMSKEVFLEAVIGERFAGITLPLAVAVAASALAFAYAGKVFLGTFWGREAPQEGRGYPRSEISPWLLLVPAVLLVPQVVGGVIPGWYLGSVLEPGTEWPEGFAVWHHLDVLLAASLSVFTLGILLYAVWRRIAAAPDVPGPQRLSDGIAAGSLAHGAWLGQFVQRGGHPRFIAVTLIAAVAAMAGAVLWAGGEPGTSAAFALPAWGPEGRVAWLPALAVAVAAVLTIVLPRRISKVVTMAIVGYGITVFYVLFRAPDLALTQLLVETVSLILLLLIFRRMPELRRDPRSLPRKWAHASVAILVGLTMGALAWSAGSYPARDRAGYEQLALSLPKAKGENAVNVILVDFRGADTMGEIVVLCIAALGAVALFRARRDPEEVDA